MKEWKDDKALITLIKAELYTAVIGDIMDKMGYINSYLPVSGHSVMICW